VWSTQKGVHDGDQDEGGDDEEVEDLVDFDDDDLAEVEQEGGGKNDSKYFYNFLHSDHLNNWYG